jgi:ubiquitin-conjugating enzyme E2 O
VTTVRVIWQDGTQEDIRATELIPYLTIDEYDVWYTNCSIHFYTTSYPSPFHRPGDPVLWKTEDGINPSIVQDVDAQARTAHVRVWDTGAIERVSLLELDAYGTGAAVGGGNTPSNFDSLGVRRGDFVFIHAEGTVNGAEKGRVPRIGEVPAWVREVVMEENGSIAGWRGEMNTLGIQLAQGRGGPPPKGEGEIRKTERGDTSFNWLGEVTDVGFLRPFVDVFGLLTISLLI